MKFSKKEIIIYSSIALVVLAVLITFAVLVLTYFPYEFTKGDGSKNNPYLLETYEDLLGLSNNVNNGNDYKNIYFRLNNDIHNEHGTKWIPIGNDKTPFRGIFDGNKKNITNLSFNDDDSYANGGFFGVVENEVEDFAIKNLTLEVGVVEIKENFDNFGIVAGKICGNITGVVAKGIITTKKTFDSLGLIVGDLVGNATACEADGVIDVTLVDRKECYIGGAFAKVEGDLSDCLSEVHISETFSNDMLIDSNCCTGGLVSYIKSENGIIKNCRVGGIIKSIGTTGGIVGNFVANLEVVNCIRTDHIEVNVHNDCYVGGVIGYNNFGKMTLSETYSVSSIVVNENHSKNKDAVVYVGGLIGNSKGEIYNSSFAQSIYVACEMSATVGGIAGKFDGNICQSYSLADIEVVSAASNVKIGGLVAELDGEDNAISTCYSSGKICYSSINRLQQTELEDRVGYVIGECLSESLNLTHVYYTNNNIDSASRLFPSSVVGYCSSNSVSENITNNIVLVEIEDLTSGERLDGFGRYISQQDLIVNTQNVWRFKEGDFPILYYQSYEE